MARSRTTHPPTLAAVGAGGAAVHATAWTRAIQKKESRRFSRHAPLIAILMLALVSVRLHELVPPLRFIRPVLLVGFVGVGMIIVQSSAKARLTTLRYTPVKIVLAYLLWIGLLIPSALWPGRAFQVFWDLIPSVLTFVACQLVAPNRTNADKVATWFASSAAALAVGAFLMGGDEAGRLTVGETFDPNDMAALLAAAAPFTLGVALRKGRKIRFVMLGALVVIAAAIVATQSRGGLIAFVAGCLVFGWGFNTSKRIGMIIGMVIAALVGWTFTGDAFRERVKSLLELESDYNMQDFDGRIQVWTRGISYVKESPVLGVGPGGFGLRDGQWLASAGMTGKWSAAHNAYIQSFAETGVLGGLLFTGLLGLSGLNALALWRRRRNPYHRPEYLGSVAALCVAAFFLSMAYSWIVFGVTGVIALGDRARRADERARKLGARAAHTANLAAASSASQQPVPGSPPTPYAL